ncbi:PorT family protein [Aureibaculum algae]|uniref:PorT family protein n=1 Tax=Aureibaculum algae TaxID=2584122 RepID=A0A5B7TXL0_9FLAO|nr:outer membrane beta-barrel protein [Aureibaculum algae]QCX39577.1 PorT family protein [Aureibaculum algae]
MKNILILLISILSINCYSQITYNKGYFINNSDKKIDCEIKNIDWKNNPTEFEYRISEDKELKTASIASVKEFGIYKYSKYIRSNVDIDRSSNRIEELNTHRNPVFKNEELFLKVLVEGNANLYSYNNTDVVRYFYSKEGSDIEQLVYKRYKINQEKIAENVTFRQQLLNNLKCQHISSKDINKTNYGKNKLIKLFVKYNQCENSELIDFENIQKKDLFNLTFRPRINSTSFSVDNSRYNSTDSDFNTNINFGFGIEAEFIMPFNKNKWSVIIEPTYNKYKSKIELTTQRIQSVEAKYNSIELPIGIRHYFFINDDSKVFVNASTIFDISYNSNVDYEISTDLNIISTVNLAFGAGYKFKDKYSIEFRYHLNKDVLDNYTSWYSTFGKLSLVLGYSIF